MNFFALIDANALFVLPLSDSDYVLTALAGITHLGDARFIAILGISMALVLWRHGRHSYWIGLGVAVFGALASSWLLKILIARPRPMHTLVEVSGYSLPSMHAAVAVALYGYLIFATLRLLHPPHHRAPWAAALAAIALLIGLSRIYLKVHYATDVLAGFMLGALWVYAGYRAQRATAPRRGQ
ncbi:MAG: phosphatase PAP2 family protein [Minisyncoccota bacterium]